MTPAWAGGRFLGRSSPGRASSSIEPVWEAPDYLEVLSGWRVWRVVKVKSRLLLASVIYNSLWEPRCELTAMCMCGWGLPRRWVPPPEHAAPQAGCECGVYAAAELGEAVRYLDRTWARVRGRGRTVQYAIGRVALWGAVIECEQGWRGELAYPQRLWVPTGAERGRPFEQASTVAEALTAYGVPVERLDAGVDVAEALGRLSFAA
jgi:hypothetical protein